MTSDLDVISFAEQISRQSSVKDKWQLLHKTALALGFSGATYGLSPGLRSGTISQEVIYYMSHRKDFFDTYVTEALADDDYAVLHCANASFPALFSTIADRYPTRRTGLFQEVIEDFGLSNGLVIPFHEPGSTRISGLGLTFDTGVTHDTLPPGNLLTMLRIAEIFDQEMRGQSALRQTYRLSPRELDCLSHLCTGKLNKEIADALGLADKTVEHYLRNAGRKLKARNKHHLAAKAVMLGVISV